MLGPPEAYVSSIHVVDAGRAVTAALSVPAGVYNVVDDLPRRGRKTFKVQRYKFSWKACVTLSCIRNLVTMYTS